MILRISGLLLVGISLAACSASGGGGGGRNSEIATSQQVLNQYQRSFASGNREIPAAKAQGIEGVASVTQTYGDGAQDNGFARSRLQTNGNTISVTSNGVTTNGVRTGGSPQNVNGRFVQYDQYQDGPNRSIATVTGTYSALAEVANYNTGNGTQVTYNAFGLETPVQDLPRQQALYGGNWQATLPGANVKTGGRFDMEADFARGRVGWNTYDNAGINGSGTGTISGARFTGNSNIAVGDHTGRAEVVGGFFGPRAEEVGGVMNGTVSRNGQSYDMVGGFIGNQNQ